MQSIVFSLLEAVICWGFCCLYGNRYAREEDPMLIVRLEGPPSGGFVSFSQ
ncbi:hypothetical protein SLEP1_g13914 [Rubroshorea leprosula]|uniref:Uncharacterized protein n=1 Tax=Rubroshorea leprosula TaxID=152421 RepID=A0AAV5ITX6_9ROSI|nr:hypothetical protein SLEP1_g13914 [Rubroshorea leprosula]